MKILVVGAGAVGGFYGGKLSQAGAEVSLVCRSDYDQVRADGLRVDSAWGDFSYRPRLVTRSAREYADVAGPADLVMVTLKVLPEIDVPALIADAVGPDTAIFLLQNGIDIEQPVADAFPDNKIVSGLAFVCINRIAPGHIHHLDYGHLMLGDFPSGAGRLATELHALFANAGVATELTDDIKRARWMKLVWNAPYNPLSVLCGSVTTRDIMASKECAALTRQVMEEVVAIAAAQGIELPPDIIEKNIAYTDNMEPYKTSMLLDFEAGRRLETEAILGTAVNAARAHNVPAPHMETMYALLQMVAAKPPTIADSGSPLSGLPHSSVEECRIEK